MECINVMHIKYKISRSFPVHVMELMIWKIQVEIDLLIISLEILKIFLKSVHYVDFIL